MYRVKFRAQKCLVSSTLQIDIYSRDAESKDVSGNLVLNLVIAQSGLSTTKVLFVDLE